MNDNPWTQMHTPIGEPVAVAVSLDTEGPMQDTVRLITYGDKILYSSALWFWDDYG